jgi:hypothetical protein
MPPHVILRRKRLLPILGVGIAFAISVAMTAPLPAHGQSSSQVASQIDQAYVAVLSAERSGGNITSLVVKLNSAVSLLQQADAINETDPSRAQSLYSKASALALQVSQAAPTVSAAGRAAVFNSQLDLGVETTILTALAVVAYLYTPKIFWRFWLRTHKGWRVKKQ